MMFAPVRPEPFLSRMATPSSDPRGAHDVRVAAAYYDGYASRYDADVDGQAPNARLRAAFQRRVVDAAGTGGTILDFGCGTGTDALWYAARGHRVIAYDVSIGMLAVLRARCARGVTSGAVMPVAGELEALLEVLRREAPVAVIAADFAALNHVGDLGPLFAALAPHLTAGGAIVASLLNPIAA